MNSHVAPWRRDSREQQLDLTSVEHHQQDDEDGVRASWTLPPDVVSKMENEEHKCWMSCTFFIVFKKEEQQVIGKSGRRSWKDFRETSDRMKNVFLPLRIKCMLNCITTFEVTRRIVEKGFT